MRRRVSFRLNQLFLPSQSALSGRLPPPRCLPGRMDDGRDRCRYPSVMRLKSLRLKPPLVRRILPDCELFLTQFLSRSCPTPLPEHRGHYVSGKTTHGPTLPINISSQHSSGHGNGPSFASERVPLVLGETSPSEEQAPWTHHRSPLLSPPTSLATPHFRVTDRYLKAQKQKAAIK